MSQSKMLLSDTPVLAEMDVIAQQIGSRADSLRVDIRQLLLDKPPTNFDGAVSSVMNQARKIHALACQLLRVTKA